MKNCWKWWAAGGNWKIGRISDEYIWGIVNLSRWQLWFTMIPRRLSNLIGSLSFKIIQTAKTRGTPAARGSLESTCGIAHSGALRQVDLPWAMHWFHHHLTVPMRLGQLVLPLCGSGCCRFKNCRRHQQQSVSSRVFFHNKSTLFKSAIAVYRFWLLHTD